jgi:NTP pyrophosphatase (non-canonical NTP hydrolase)
MKIDDYIELALTTESSLSPLTKEVEDRGLTNRTFHGVIGLVTETGEMLEALQKKKLDKINLLEECGDALWYLAIKINELFKDETNFFQSMLEEKTIPEKSLEDLIDLLRFISNEELDYCKKVLIYGKNENNIEEFKMRTITQFTIVVGIIKKVAGHEAIEHVLSVNISKLQQRYPGKFTSRSADIRDLDAEREILNRLQKSLNR